MTNIINLTKTDLVVDTTTVVQDTDGQQQIGDALFSITDLSGNVGTGRIAPFLSIHSNNDIESGYNSDVGGPDLPLDDVRQAFTNALKLSDLKEVVVGGETYFEFHLDINQPNNATERFVSLDAFKLLRSDDPFQTADVPVGDAVYDMDGSGDTAILIDSSLSSGSGNSYDLKVLVKASAFNQGSGDWVILYTEFGGVKDYGTGGGFEEWTAVTKDTPTAPTAGIHIDKITGDGPGGAITDGDGVLIEKGSAVTWTYTVTNTGNVALANVTVTDDHSGVTPAYQSGDTDHDGLLDVTETWTYTATGTAILGDYSNIGTATGSYNNGKTVTDDDTSSYKGYEIVHNPSITIVKDTQDGAKSGDDLNILVGDDISWVYTIKNTGDVALTDVKLTDDKEGPVDLTGTISGDTGNDHVLGVGETWTVTAEGKAGLGAYSNTGTVTGKDGGTTVTDDDTSGYFGIDGGIHIKKTTQDMHVPAGTAGDGLGIHAGEEIRWIYEVSNTGNAALSGVTVSDSDSSLTVDAVTTGAFNVGDIDTDGMLDKTETWLFEATGIAQAGSYSNTGTAKGTVTDDAGHSKNVSDSDGSSYFGVAPDIQIVKTTQDEGGIAGDGITVLEGDNLTWTYTVTNTGNFTLTDLQVSDSDPSLTLTLDTAASTGEEDNSFDAGDVWVYTATGKAGSSDYSNSATASGTSTDGAGHAVTVDDDDTSSYKVAKPHLTIDKVTQDGTVSGDGIKILAGEDINWVYTVTNDGNVDLGDIKVSDDKQGNVTTYTGDDGDGILSVGETWTFALSGKAGSGSYSNKGTATGTYTDAAGHSAEATASDTSSYTGLDPSITIDKKTQDVTAPAGTAGDGITVLKGDSVKWIYTVTNTGNVTLDKLAVTDSDPSLTLTLDTANSTGAGDGSFDKGDVWIYTATGTAGAGTYSNTGYASGSVTDDAGHSKTVTDDDGSSYFGADPKISINKVTTGYDTPTHTVTGDAVSILAGYDVTWSYEVKNTGNVALSNVEVTDDKTGVTPVYVSGDANSDCKLDLTETWLYKASGTAVYGSYSNVGKADGDFTDPAGHKAPATATDTSSYQGQFAETGYAWTKGFWGTHLSEWNGDNGDDRKNADSLVKNGVLKAADVLPTKGYILLGDTHNFGVADVDEHILKVSITAANQIINSSDSANDTRQILMSQAIATQLNIYNGAGQPNDLITEAVDWLTGRSPYNNYRDSKGNLDSSGSVDKNGDGILGTDDYDTTLKKFLKDANFTVSGDQALTSNLQAWQQLVNTNGTNDSPSVTLDANGEGLKNALMWFNDGHLVVTKANQVGWDENGAAAGGNIVDIQLNNLDKFWTVLSNYDSHNSWDLIGIA